MSEDHTHRPVNERIPGADWETIVQNVPIVSVDLVVVYEDELVLGKRKNEPARGEWFVPGGRLHKHERLTEAVERIAQEELGVSVAIKEQLGAYEHLYDTAELENVGGKHYLANGFVVVANEFPTEFDEQHERVQLFDTPPEDLHEYVRAYLESATTLPENLSITE